jgi:hypothetical protein
MRGHWARLKPENPRSQKPASMRRRAFFVDLASIVTWKMLLEIFNAACRKDGTQLFILAVNPIS